MIRVLLVDDHPIVRAGLRAVLDKEDDIDVVGDVGDAASAIATVELLQPDVVVLDLHLGDGPGGIDVLRHLRLQQTSARTLVVTVFDNDVDIDSAMTEGAAGYLLKDAPEGDLVRAVRAAAVGQHPLDPRIAARVVSKSRHDPDTPSARELEVLAAVAEGLDNATIGRRLYISQATVKSHLASVFVKLGVNSRTGALAEARRRSHLR